MQNVYDLLQDQCLVAKIGLDTAENEPSFLKLGVQLAVLAAQTPAELSEIVAGIQATARATCADRQLPLC